MHTLAQNAVNILGKNGKKWIANLPSTIQLLADYWKLTNIVPVNNMSYHYVALATCNNSRAVVVKIGFETKVTAAEKRALTYFGNNNVSIQLIDYHAKYNALLLEQAIPGNSLKSFYPNDDKFVIDCYVDTVRKLLNKSPLNLDGFCHISDWLKKLDQFKSDKLPQDLLGKAIKLKNELLASITEEKLLHGDLHHDNILKHNDSWLVIDPKGIIGETEFEMAAFDFIHATELTDLVKANKLFHERVQSIAEKSDLNANRIKEWVFVRLVLSAAWYIESKEDPGVPIKLAKILMG